MVLGAGSATGCPASLFYLLFLLPGSLYFLLFLLLLPSVFSVSVSTQGGTPVFVGSLKGASYETVKATLRGFSGLGSLRGGFVGGHFAGCFVLGGSCWGMWQHENSEDRALGRFRQELRLLGGKARPFSPPVPRRMGLLGESLVTAEVAGRSPCDSRGCLEKPL